MGNVNINLNEINLKEVFVYDFKSTGKYNEHVEDIVIFSCKSNYKNDLIKLIDNKDVKYEIIGLETKKFNGIVKEILFENLDEKTLVVRLSGVDESIKLSLNKNLKRLYQDPNMPVKKIIEDIIKDYGTDYHISKNIDMEIGRVYYQYNEDDWSFLVRLLSDFNERIFINRDGIILFGEEKLSEAEEIV
ncbi:hypothetical protein HP397_00775 [Streptobacillus felis]|uniref:Uncharacterized protein n=1 Tax=Streptobacillus felis TaxID=1384509 RepID=A0A7Z0PFP8_9FUSO|nr:hypothetical protein [Streptobacillus felis]NYV27360.1 hypothetical protein [Streptobacillus felis]